MWRYLLVLLCTALVACQGIDAPVVSEAPGTASANVMQRVNVPLPNGERLQAHWWPASPVSGGVAPPAVVLLHGCGGLYDHAPQLTQRYVETAQRLHAAGYAVLLPDSFHWRGARKVCSTRYGERAVNMAQRVQDVRAALVWVAAQPGVDVQRIGLQGWSNGASTALHVLEQRQLHSMVGEPALAGVALFYPGCAPLMRRHAKLQAVPMLLQIGASDDWTPAQPCIDLVTALKDRGDGDVTLHVYPDSYHGFDGTSPVRLRAEVPNGISSAGVHQGGNPAARAQALVALNAFWSRVLTAPTSKWP